MKYTIKSEMSSDAILIAALQKVGNEGATKYLALIKNTQAYQIESIFISNGLGTVVALAFGMKLVREKQNRSTYFGEL